MPDEDALVEYLRAACAEVLQIPPPAPDVDLFQSGILDSLSLVELLMRVESAFGFAVDVDQFEPDNLRTLRRLARCLAPHLRRDARPSMAPDAESQANTPCEPSLVETLQS